jgi:hypothetical protein
MFDTSFDRRVPVLQIAIGPAVLISGVGLLILSMTNRLARATDLCRSLARSLHDLPRSEDEPVRLQLNMLVRRTIILRKAIALAVLSELLAAIMIIELFVAALLGAEVIWMTVILFAGCLACLIAALVYFIADVNASLAALRLEVGDAWPARKSGRTRSLQDRGRD